MWILTTKENAMEIETASPKDTNLPLSSDLKQILTREQQFIKNYSPRQLLKKIPDVTNTLMRTKVEFFVRGSLIGWMCEVLQTLRKPFSYSELFKSILIMDLYVKHYPKVVEDDDMHFIGVISLYLSSKYETNAHLNVTELSIKACHGKFTNESIFEGEFLMLKVLGFNISYPSHYEILKLYLAELFENDDDVFKRIEVLSTNFLLFCLMDVHFNTYLMDELATAVIITAVRYYYTSKMVTFMGALSFGKVENFAKQEKMIVKQILLYSGNSKKIEMLARLIEKYLSGFKEKFSTCAHAIKLLDFNKDFIRN